MTSPGPTTASPAPTASCRRSAIRSISRIPVWTNTIGAAELGDVWTDPGFDPTLKRVLLRPRHRNPDAALDRLRRRRDSNSKLPEQGPLESPGAGLLVAHLVHAVTGDSDSTMY